jgi:hypothetical protein
MTQVILQPEEKQTIETEITPLALRANNLIVKNREERGALASDIKAAADLKEKIEEKFHPTSNKVKARETYEAALDTEKQFYEPINRFITAGKGAIKHFDTQEAIKIQREEREAREREEQKEREAQAQREAEARAAQEAEEKRLIEEFQKIEDERKQKEELAKKATESGNSKVAGIAAREVAKLDQELKKTQEEGQRRLDEIKEKAEAPVMEVLKFNKPAKASAKLVWKARVKNPLLACRSVGDGLIPFSAVEFKQSALNDLGKNYDGKTPVPGIEFYQEASSRI